MNVSGTSAKRARVAFILGIGGALLFGYTNCAQSLPDTTSSMASSTPAAPADLSVSVYPTFVTSSDPSQVNVSGGTPPYTLTVVTGSAALSSGNVLTPPYTGSSITVQVSDSAKPANTAIASLQVQVAVAGTAAAPNPNRNFVPATDFRRTFGRTESGTDWSSVAGTAGFLLYGPYVTDLKEQAWNATFTYTDDNNTDVNNIPIITFDVGDHTTNEVLVTKTILRQQMPSPGTYGSVTLPFTMVGRAGHSMELRTYITGNSYIKVKSVLLTPQ